MWPRVGGHVGPPTPLTPEVDRFELMPWRSSTQTDEATTENALTHVVLSSNNSTQSSSPQYLGSCVLTSYIFTVSTPMESPLLQYQHPLQMPLEPRESPRRTYQRTQRVAQHPYRLGNSDERTHRRYRPILPSLQEEEANNQISNEDIQDRSTSNIMKRDVRCFVSHQTDLQVQENTSDTGHINQTSAIQRVPPNDWMSQRQSHWEHADDPDVIITSDVQLQTDDSETGYVSNDPSEQSQSFPENELEVNEENIPEYVAAYIDVETETYPPENFVEDNITQTDEITDTESTQSDLMEDYLSPDHTESTQTDVTEDYLSPNNTECPQSDETEDYLSPNSNKESVNAHQQEDDKSVPPSCTSPDPYKFYSLPLPGLPAASYKARQVANTVIKHARNHKTFEARDLRCPNCQVFPVLPVTGLCGHTRCTGCIEIYGDCPCGVQAPTELHVNTVIQYIVGKMLQCYRSRSRQHIYAEEGRAKLMEEPVLQMRAEDADMPKGCGGGVLALKMRPPSIDDHARIPLTSQLQFEYARRLITVGRYRDAAPHFARVAASQTSRARAARSLLAQIITVLAEGSDPRLVSRDLMRAVRLQGASSWLKASDLECVLCYHTYVRPVTTPCGHTYCRTCIERALDYRKACALCLRRLDDFEVTTVGETVFVSAALESIGASQPPLPPEPDVIPIFVCTVAYPSIPCPLFIFDPRYWMMIRRVLESGSRKFGMVAYERDRNYSDYGTVLEVCDCVHLEDGRSFLSTVGLSRFRVIERDVRDGCDVARIQPLTDISPIEDVTILDMRCLGSQILYKALMWLNGMNKTVRAEIETAFGEIPQFDNDNEMWWDTPDGPAWLWWLIAILPLRSEIKVLILSTKNLLKRMMAVSRTLEAIDQVAITTTSTSECEIRSALTNAEEWLERGS